MGLIYVLPRLLVTLINKVLFWVAIEPDGSKTRQAVRITYAQGIFKGIERAIHDFSLIWTAQVHSYTGTRISLVQIPNTYLLDLTPNSKLPLQIFPKCLQLVLVCILCRPTDHQPLVITCAGLGNDVKVYVVHNLMGDRSIVL